MDKNIEYQLGTINDQMSSSFSVISEKGGQVSGSAMSDMAGSIASIKGFPEDPESDGEFLLVDKVSSDGAVQVWESKAAVAVTGDYNDLKNQPVIPAPANNGVLTILRNGTAVDTFSANAAADKAINVEVPARTSELENDAGYQTASEVSSVVSSAVTAVSSSLASEIAAKQELLDPVSGGHITITSGNQIAADLSGYAEESWVSGEISSVSSALASNISLKQDKLVPVSGGHIVITSGNQIAADLSGYATQGWVTSELGTAVSGISAGMTSLGSALASDISAKQDILVPVENGGIIISGVNIQVDSSVYMPGADISSALAQKQDALSAASGLYISGSEIGAVYATVSGAGIVKPDNSTVFVDSNGTLSANAGMPVYPASSGAEPGMLYAEPGSQGVWASASELKTPGKPMYGYIRMLTSGGRPVNVPNISALNSVDAQVGDVVEVEDIGLPYYTGTPMIKTGGGGDFPEAPGWSLFNGETIRDAFDLIHVSGFGPGESGVNDPDGAMLVYNPQGTPHFGSAYGTWDVTAPEDLVDGSTIVYDSSAHVFKAIAGSSGGGSQIHYENIYFSSEDISGTSYEWVISGTVTTIEAVHLFRNGLLLYSITDYISNYSSNTLSFKIDPSEFQSGSGDKYMAEVWYF